MGGHFDHMEGDGSIYVTYPKIKPADVTRGLSNTILVMEKAVSSNNYQPPGDIKYYWEFPGWVHCAHWTTMRLISVNLLSDDDARSRLDALEQGFGSPHPGVINAVFGDGSVHPLSMNIESQYKYQHPNKSNVLKALGTRNDGSVIDVSEL